MSKLNDYFPKNQETTTLLSDLKILLEHSKFGLENKENIENYKNQSNPETENTEKKLQAKKSNLIKKFLKNSPADIKIAHSNSMRNLESSQTPRLRSKKLSNLANIEMTTNLPTITIDSSNNLESVESIPFTSRSEDLQDFRVSASNLINRKNSMKILKSSNFKKNRQIGNRKDSGNNNIFSTYYESFKDSDSKDLEEDSKVKNSEQINNLFYSEYYENSNDTIINMKNNEDLKNFDQNFPNQWPNKNTPCNLEKIETSRDLAKAQSKVENPNFSKFKFLYKYPFKKVEDTVASLKFYKKIFHKINGEPHKCSSNCEYLKRCYKNKDLRSSCSPREELQHNKVVIDKLPLIFE